MPGHGDELYGLTDRGPNVDGPDGSKIEPVPSFTPAIGRFQLKDGRAKLLQSIPLRAADGTRYNGQVNSSGQHRRDDHRPERHRAAGQPLRL